MVAQGPIKARGHDGHSWPSPVAAGHGRGDCSVRRPFRVDREIQDLAAGSGALGQEADTCPFDRDPDIDGIRAVESCRARHFNLFGECERESVGVR